MPVISKNVGIENGAEQLATELADALRQPIPTRFEPLIVENRIAQTKSAHVVVIWDQWRDLSPSERSEIILDACAKVKRFANSTITVAMGLTSDEAMRSRFLRYSIVTTRRNGDKTTTKELDNAMSGAGGIVVKVGSSTQLRFPTLEQAEDAYRHLSQVIPGPYWAIVHEQPSPE